MRSVLAITVLLASFAIASCSPPNQRETTDGILKNVDQDAANWRMYGRAYDDHRFSPLTQINEQTVPGLGLVWSKDLGTTRGLEATPLVENGIIYTTGSWSVVYAYNAKTGERHTTRDIFTSLESRAVLRAGTRIRDARRLAPRALESVNQRGTN